MSLDDYTGGLAPKVAGSWNLHSHFATQDSLDFYIMLSSLVGVIGFASQSNYSAGGAYQDALASYRVQQGLPGVSIDLAAVKSVGYLAEDDGAKTIEALQRQGFMALSEDDVLTAIGSAISTPYAGSLVLGLNTGPPANHSDGSAAVDRDLRFACLAYQPTDSDGDENGDALKTAAAHGGDDLAIRLAASTTLDEAAGHVVDALARKLTDIFLLADGDVVPSKSLGEFGVDSLVAVELRNMVGLRAGAEMSIFEIMQSASVGELARGVAVRSRFVERGVVEGG